MISYDKFLRRKQITDIETGFRTRLSLNKALFPFQRDCVRWALKRGRACLFQDCGLGKTIQQLEWARHVHHHTKGNILILAPIAVARQTISEGRKFGIRVHICSSQSDVKKGINITNYEKLHKFDTSAFTGVVLDESSILKSFSGKYRSQIIRAFSNTPYKLACTATPAPNDYMELGNHSEFLGIMTRMEMLSMFFINDSGDTGKWRLKGHAESEFWKWLCSWAVYLRKPSDLGYDDNGFILPKIHYHPHVVKVPQLGSGTLLFSDVSGILGRRRARRRSLDDRVGLATELVNKSDEVWLLWCDLNEESRKLKEAINGAVEVKGSDSEQHKTKAMLDFASGKIKALISKPSICGFGMNFQICHNVVFVGLSDSYESFYQAVRRCWRFGQKHDVHVHIITSEAENVVVANVKRKEENANRMAAAMIQYMSDISKNNLKGAQREEIEYKAQMDMELPSWIR